MVRLLRPAACSITLVFAAMFGVSATASDHRQENAAERVFRHTGEISGQPNSSVRLRLERADASYKLKELRFNRVTGACGGEKTNEINLSIGRPLRVGASGRFKERLENRDGSALVVDGLVKRRGRVVRGHLRTSLFDAGDENCKVDRVGFTTRGVPGRECGEFLGVANSTVCIRLRGGSRPSQISSLRFDGLPVSCDNGAAVPAAGAASRIPIESDGHFRTSEGKITGPFTRERVRIRGKIKPDNRAASGTVEVSYKDRDGVTCAVGPFPWEA